MKLKILEDAFKFFKDKGLLRSKVAFKCYDSSIFSYYLKCDDGFEYEINIISDDTLLDKMEILDLINMKRLEFFQYRCSYFGKLSYEGEMYSSEKSINNN